MDQIDMFAKILKECDVDEAKLQTLDFVLGLTGSEEGLKILCKKSNAMCASMIDLTYHANRDIAQKAAMVLVNISAETDGVNFLSSLKLSTLPSQLKNNVFKQDAGHTIFPVLFDHVLQEMSSVTQYAVMILVNLSRNENITRTICDHLKNVEEVIEMIAELAVKTSRTYDHLSSLLANLSQLQEVRRIMLGSKRDTLCKLLTLIDNQAAITRRSGIISIIRNLCLSVDNHECLLDPRIDLLSRLLLPLAGPEEFDDEDNDKLPVELQYLPEDKKRECDPSIRKQLLEIIMQLCSTQFGREVMRKNNVYVILRELHKWEMNDDCLTTCEDVVNLLLRTEEEIGVDNLRNIEVPPELTEKFNALQ